MSPGARLLHEALLRREEELRQMKARVARAEVFVDLVSGVQVESREDQCERARCRAKRAFRTAVQASQVAVIQMTRVEEVLSYYKCRWCGMWHLTHKRF